jgi:hypothetical protein
MSEILQISPFVGEISLAKAPGAQRQNVFLFVIVVASSDFKV